MQRIDRYRLEEEIARGAFGAVFRARDVELERDVALKVLLARETRSAEAAERFRREGEALARIRHPNVVAVHEVGEAHGRPYLVLDLIQGETLEQRLARDGPLPLDEATALVQTLAAALHHVHERGLLHRDLKPGNVLIRADDGAVLLTDFGLALDEASDRTRLSQTGHMLGTPGYWAPEQARGDLAGLGPATDVYGLGALYYACLTGEPPVVGESLMEILAAGEAGRIDPPSLLRPGLPRSVDRVCMQALARDPARRYASVAVLAGDLERLRSGSRVQARALRRLPAGALAAVIALALMAGGLLLWRGYVRPTQIADRLERLRLKVDKHRYTEGLPLADELVAFAPEEPEGWTLRAKIRLAQGAFDEAAADLERALALRPDFIAALLVRANLRAQTRDPSGARTDYDTILRLDPNRREALYRRSFLRWSTKDLEGATADLGRALADDPDPHGGQFLAYAERLFKLGRLPEAEAACARGIELFGPAPDGTNRGTANACRYLRGRIRKRRGDLKGAEADWTAATRLVPQSVSTWWSLGVLRYERKDFAGAIAAFSRALDIAPNYTPARLLRGRSYEQRRALRKALVDYDQLLKGRLLPADAVTARYRRGRVRAELLDFQGAERDFSVLVERDPKDVRALARRAEARVSLGRLPEALRDIDRVLALLPNGSPDQAAMRRRRATLVEMTERRRAR